MTTKVDKVGKTTRIIFPEGRILALTPREDLAITWIMSIMIYDGYRDKGIGQFLLSSAKAYLRSHHLLLEPVSTGLMKQEALVKWYEKNGFKFLTEEESFYIAHDLKVPLASPRLMYSSPLRNKY